MTPQTPFGENLLGELMLGAASALQANEQTILNDLGSFTVKIDGGITDVEEDIESKLNPVLKGVVQGAFSMLNPIIEGQIPTIEGDGLTWLINTLNAEGKKLTGS
jgi:hypothetical protein